MKPHKHAKLIKAWADGAQIEYWDFKERWVEVANPCWEMEMYRIKPELKPDYRKYFIYQKDRPCIYPCEHNNLPNIVLYFDGKTGKLKSAEVLE